MTTSYVTCLIALVFWSLLTNFAFFWENTHQNHHSKWLYATSFHRQMSKFPTACTPQQTGSMHFRCSEHSTSTVQIRSYCRCHDAAGSVQRKIFFFWCLIGWILNRAPPPSVVYFRDRHVVLEGLVGSTARRNRTSSWRTCKDVRQMWIVWPPSQPRKIMRINIT